ncbi:MAG: tetratricopeptide repeat protein [Nitrospirota bacterium]|nr:tetratricopeptide repeat protein [Nitrospirota bacterium]
MIRTLLPILLLLLSACASTGTNELSAKTKMAQGYYDRGINYLQMRDFEHALVEFQRSIKTDSKYKLSYYALGVVNDMMGKYADAEKFYEEALDIDSEFSEAHNALGVIYTKQQKWKNAQKSFQKALENKIYSTPHVPYLNLGDMFMAQREYGKATEAYLESKRLVNQDIAVYKLGMAMIAAGNVREALAELQEGAALSPKNPDMRFALAMAHLKSGNKRAAISEFRKVTELAPKTEMARTAQDYVTTLEKDESKTKKNR